MTCPTCDGHAHMTGIPCPACYGSGDTDAQPVVPALVVARLTLRAEAWVQQAHNAQGRSQAPAACLREAALCRAAAVAVLGCNHLERSRRDMIALHGVEAAIASGMDLEPYVVLLTRWVSERCLGLIVQTIRGASTDLRVSAKALEVLRG